MARKKKDGRYLAELKQSCANKAAEWEQRQKDAAGEMAAIAKAKEILAEGVKVFLQARAQRRWSSEYVAPGTEKYGIGYQVARGVFQVAR